VNSSPDLQSHICPCRISQILSHSATVAAAFGGKADIGWAWVQLDLSSRICDVAALPFAGGVRHGQNSAPNIVNIWQEPLEDAGLLGVDKGKGVSATVAAAFGGKADIMMRPRRGS
jgi:hypothetical protein